MENWGKKMFSTMSAHFLTLHSASHAPNFQDHHLPSSAIPSVLFLLRPPPKQLRPLRPPLPLLIASASSSSDDPPPPESESESESVGGDGIEIEAVRIGVNRRRVQARVRIGAGLDVVWGVLTDYEGLADFIPSLSECRLLERKDNFVKIFQTGQQELGLGFKFIAKGILDCYEKDLEVLPNCKKRDIDFKMVEGDFQTFEGTWSMTENDGTKCEDGIVEGQEFSSVLSYAVDVEPKLWLPVRLIEGRICMEVRDNLSCIREEARKIQNVIQGTFPSR